MIIRLPVITLPASGQTYLESLQSQESGVQVSISRSETSLLKLNIAPLTGLLFITWLSLVMSMMVSFVLSFFPRDVLDEILNLIESVSEDFSSYSYYIYNE